MRNPTITIKVISLLILISVLSVSSLSAGQQDSRRKYPLPLPEAENILAYWLRDTGFETLKTVSDSGYIQFNAVKKNERWQITLKPFSPLASEVLAVYTLNDLPDQMKVQGMWDYLETYSGGIYPSGKKGHPEQAVPSAVLAQKKSVVCIRAKKKDKPIQFSGFIIDKEGLIISTAHDLEGVRDIVVVLDDGSEVKGRINKMDTDSDLALISIKSEVKSRISLEDSRNLPDNGEMVYFIGCPMNHQGMIQSGIIDGLPRSVNGHPLWQVYMETLPGSSGSPVLDANGSLFGVIKGRYRGTDSRGFVITINTLMDFLSRK